MSDDDDGSSGIIGKLIKYAVILAITGIFPPFLLFYIGWKYVKLCVKFYFKALYLIIRLPIWLFIQLPLHYLGVSMHKMSEAFGDAYGVIITKKKRYGLLFGLLFFFMLQAFLPRNVDAVMSFLTDATLILPFLVLIPFFITFMVALFSAHMHTPDIARKNRPGGLDTGMKSKTAGGAVAAGIAAQAGMKAYNHKDEIKAAKGAAEGGVENAGKVASEAASGETLAAAEGETILAGDMVATLEGMPLIGGMMTGAGEAAALGGTAVGASGGTILIALGAAIVGFFLISAILTFFLWGALMWLTSFLAPVMGPILGALGLGQAYGNWIGSEVANNFFPQVDLTAESRMIQETGAKINCALQGPACLRQWRMNNTARPGSRDVGEEYKLEVDRFSLGGQGGIDIAYKRPDYKVPVSFLLLNTRHGLKGIEANDVRWRVRIGDADRSGKKAYCSTGWNNVKGTVGEEGTILPGTSFSPRLNDLEDLTLEECEMLQPALGHDYTGELDVKYDYSSQSTLYVRAMSRRNMRDEDITPEFKKSETADTPVETFINVKEPITYVESENNGGNGPRQIPFTVKVGTNTDMYDVEYRVKPDEFEIIDSARTEHQGNGSCVGLAHEEGNEYGLSDRAEERMNRKITPNDPSTWFNKNNNPTPSRCTFELSNPGTISPTGETLTMRVDANYTVVIEETSDPFEVRNTMCTDINCPVLFRMNSSDFVELVDSGIPPTQWVLEESELSTNSQTEGENSENEGSENTNSQENPFGSPGGNGDSSNSAANSDSSNSNNVNGPIKPVQTELYRKYDQAKCDGIDASEGDGCTAVKQYRTTLYPKEDRTPIEEGELAVEWNEETASTGKIFSCQARSGNVSFEKNVVGLPLEDLESASGNERYSFDVEDGDLSLLDYKRTLDLSTVEWANKAVPDWLLDVEASVTKTPNGCTEGKPEYRITCSDLDVDGVGTFVSFPALALNIATDGENCS